jgi:hypothetical protein
MRGNLYFLSFTGRMGAALSVVVNCYDATRFFTVARAGKFNVHMLSPSIQTLPTDLCTNVTYWNDMPVVDCGAELDKYGCVLRQLS